MILKKEKPQPGHYQLKEKTKFAIFPTRMKRNENDYFGSIIWLEKYIVTYRYKNNSIPSKIVKSTWQITHKETPSNFTLRKLSEDCQKEKSEGEDRFICTGATGAQNTASYAKSPTSRP